MHRRPPCRSVAPPRASDAKLLLYADGMYAASTVRAAKRRKAEQTAPIAQTLYTTSESGAPPDFRSPPAVPQDNCSRRRQSSARSKRSGQPCRAPAVRGWQVCRMHGARGGAPHGTGTETTSMAAGLRKPSMLAVRSMRYCAPSVNAGKAAHRLVA
jgi:hypothetical protein